DHTDYSDQMQLALLSFHVTIDEKETGGFMPRIDLEQLLQDMHGLIESGQIVQRCSPLKQRFKIEIASVDIVDIVLDRQFDKMISQGDVFFVFSSFEECLRIGIHHFCILKHRQFGKGAFVA